MEYAIEKVMNRIIPEDVKTIIEDNRTIKVMVDGEREEFVVLSPDEMLNAYEEQKDLFDYDIMPIAYLDDDYLCLRYNDHNISIIYWNSERAMEEKSLAIFELYESYRCFMRQPTKEEITNKVRMFLNGSEKREDICEWAMNYIRDDEQISINDVHAWHYLVEISNIDEMIAPKEYLFDKEDIEDIIEKYDR